MPDNMDYQLDRELLELEAQLASLVPSAVPADLAASVSAQIDQSLIDAAVDVHDAELKDLEAHLGLLAPAGMSTEVLSRMTEAMDRWHEHVPVEEKVVPFGQKDSKQDSASSIRAARKSGSNNMYGAAAAVALLGAAAALVLPNWKQDDDPALVSGGSATEPALDTFSSTAPIASALDVTVEDGDAWLVPNSLSHNVTHTSDAGVLMSRDNIPHRSIRIDYVDRVIVLSEDGREIEINRPGVQYMLIPVQTN